MTRPSGIAAFAAVTAIVFWLSAAPTVAASERTEPRQEPAMNCNLVTGDLYWFCRSLASSDCNLAERRHYWLCKGLVDNNCSLVESADYWWCEARVKRNCNLAARGDYWSCKGMVEDCNAGPREEHDFCRAVAAFFRTPGRS